MKKTILLLMIMLSVTFLFACGNNKVDPEELVDSVEAMSEDVVIQLSDASDQGIKAYAEAKEKAEEKKKKEEEKKKRDEEEDEDDPANADSTADIGSGTSMAAMQKKYIGTWELQGIIQGDGNLDMSSGAYCTYVFKSDKTYTAKGVDANGKKINESGTWKLNSKKQMVAGEYTMGIDASGYMLKDTGERDGKGRKMKYAFVKS